MTSFFLNPWMLWMLPVASIPIIIHILNRRRHRIVDWGAMRFLKFAFVTRHKRIRLEELILLILRTLMLLLLVLLMARPFLRSRIFSSEANHKDLVIILDSSFSMGLKTEGTTHFAVAKGQAQQAIDTLSKGDSVSVLLGAHVPKPLFKGLSYDFQKVKDALVRSHESLSSLNLVSCLDSAFRTLRTGQNPIREILIITDGQAHGWETRDLESWKSIAAQLDEFDRPPRIYVMTLDRPGRVTNLGLAQMPLRHTVVGTDRDVRVTVGVRNTGTENVADGSLTFSVDGTRQRRVSLEPLATGTETTASFDYRFKSPGSHFVTAELSTDMLHADDRVHLGVEVLQSLPVLLVDGGLARGQEASETIFLASALRPTARYVVKPTVIAPAKLRDTDLVLYRAVVLANVRVADLDVGDVSKLTGFVRRGGGLLIVPGEDVNVDAVNAALWRGGAGLLPAQMIAVTGDATKREGQFRISETGLANYAATKLLADKEKSDLGDTRIHRYVKMSAAGVGASVVLRLANGDPLLVEKKIDKGRVMVVACPFDLDWSDLAMRNAFVVLAHEIVYTLASPLLPAQNIGAGKDLVIVLDDLDPADTVDLDLPLAAPEQLPVRRKGGRREAVLENTRNAGLYKATWHGRTGLVRRYYVVNFDPAESDLTSLGDSAREIITAQTDTRFYDNWTALERALKVGQDTRELWRWLAVLTVILLLAEVVLTRMFSRRRALESDSVTFGA